MAHIAFDLRALNGISRYRGIGMYTVEIANRLIPKLTKNHSVTLYAVVGDDLTDILPKNRKKCTVVLSPMPKSRYPLGPISKITEDVVPSAMNVNISLPELDTVDVFWQPYFYFGTPNNRSIKTIMVAYDFIPLVFLDQFFGNITMRRNKIKQVALNTRRKLRLTSIRNAVQRFEYAHTVLAISENTKRDLSLFTKTKQKNITVTLLGPPEVNHKADKALPAELTGRTFIFYIGGIDYRRDLKSLVGAFERAKQKHPDLQLVLAGKDFEDIRDAELLQRLQGSAFAADIHNLGFVDNTVRQALYEHAEACVYPTLYEGFGLPILEGFAFNCPVITNKNSSTPEVGGKAALYATGEKSLAQSITKVLSLTKEQRRDMTKQGKQQAAQFSWDKCAEETLTAFYKALDT